MLKNTTNGTAKGVNVGADVTYLFTKTLGAGVFARYNGGSVSLDSVSDVKAGGFQLGIGARLPRRIAGRASIQIEGFPGKAYAKIDNMYGGMYVHGQPYPRW